MPNATPFNLPFDEAIAWFRDKDIELSPDSWRQVWEQANVKSFTVARVAARDILQDIKDEVQKALDEGISLDEFKSNLRPMLERKGWLGTEDTTPWRLETIYRTNLQSAYSAGRYKQMMEVTGTRPYWQYKAILDGKTRPNHSALNNLVYRFDAPFWSTNYPPNGFNCRCYVKTLSQSDLEERNLDVESRTSEVQPDQGWAYNVGQEGLAR